MGENTYPIQDFNAPPPPPPHWSLEWKSDLIAHFTVTILLLTYAIKGPLKNLDIWNKQMK